MYILEAVIIDTKKLPQQLITVESKRIICPKCSKESIQKYCGDCGELNEVITKSFKRNFSINKDILYKEDLRDSLYEEFINDLSIIIDTKQHADCIYHGGFILSELKNYQKSSFEEKEYVKKLTSILTEKNIPYIIDTVIMD